MHFKFTKACRKSELYVGYSDNSMGHSLNEPFVARANLTFLAQTYTTQCTKKDIPITRCVTVDNIWKPCSEDSSSLLK